LHVWQIRCVPRFRKQCLRQPMSYVIVCLPSGLSSHELARMLLRQLWLTGLMLPVIQSIVTISGRLLLLLLLKKAPV